MMKDLKPTFNVYIWSKSVSISEMENNIKIFELPVESDQKYQAYQAVVNFDFNGDGRLSLFEYIEMIILEVIPKMNVVDCRNCLRETVVKLIQPIFYYLDCDNNGYLDYEEMFTAMEKLKKPQHLCDMFKCKDESGEYKRTDAINDFIIKAPFKTFEVKDDGINKFDFAARILAGYLMRHVRENSIESGEFYTRKLERWNNLMDEDLKCN